MRIPWSSRLRLQDLVWLLLFAGLYFIGPVRNDAELEVLGALALFQLIRPRVPWLNTERGTGVSVLIQLALGWLLIGVTYGVESSYYWILLLPIVTAATSFGFWGTVFFVTLACASYLSFILWVDMNQAIIPEREMREIALRAMFYGFIGYVVYELSAESRRETRLSQEVAAQLAATNTQLQAAEETVRRTERLAALGQLTAGLAHELRNPLGTIKNSAELLAKRVPATDAITQELAGYVQTEVDRANSLVTRFLQFARPFHLQKSAIEIADIVERAILRVQGEHPAITFVRNFSPGVPPVQADAELIEQVFVNLLANAAQASPPGAVVTARTRASDEVVEAAVIDRGAGIDPNVRASIFNPFFTTKPAGTGLGLAIVQKIIDEHDGRILVDSHPGEGASFRVHLPIAG